MYTLCSLLIFSGSSSKHTYYMDVKKQIYIYRDTAAAQWHATVPLFQSGQLLLLLLLNLAFSYTAVRRSIRDILTSVVMLLESFLSPSKALLRFVSLQQPFRTYSASRRRAPAPSSAAATCVVVGGRGRRGRKGGGNERERERLLFVVRVSVVFSAWVYIILRSIYLYEVFSKYYMNECVKLTNILYRDGAGIRSFSIIKQRHPRHFGCCMYCFYAVFRIHNVSTVHNLHFTYTVF